MYLNKGKDKLKIKVVQSPEAVMKGMMGKKFGPSYQGMLFVMGKDEQQSFWMKNCIIPLDIIFLHNNKITKIHKNCKPCESEVCPHYYGDGNFVLELDGGMSNRLGLEEGETLSFSL